MYYVLLYDYVPDMAARRAPFREAHLALLSRLHERGELVMAGAWSDPLDGAALVFHTPSPAAIEEFVASDPYVANGLVARWRIREWSLVVGAEPALPALSRTATGNAFRFCPKCGERLEERAHGGRPRLTCRGCGFIFYRNPIAGVAVVVVREGRVLLGRRAPGRDRGQQWCIPCGYVEWGEEVREAAGREFLEETGLEVEVGDLYAVHSNFHNADSLTVGIWFRGRVTGGALQAGDDLDAVDYFPLNALPEPLAFPTDRLVLEKLRRELRRQGGGRC